MKAEFRVSVYTTSEDEGVLYSEALPPMPVPGRGDDVYVSGEGRGWWRVVEVSWALPAQGAMIPSMWLTLKVEWSEVNDRPRPIYDDDQGWTSVG
jgi:hypothetical protein